MWSSHCVPEAMVKTKAMIAETLAILFSGPMSILPVSLMTFGFKIKLLLFFLALPNLGLAQAAGLELTSNICFLASQDALEVSQWVCEFDCSYKLCNKTQYIRILFIGYIYFIYFTLFLCFFFYFSVYVHTIFHSSVNINPDSRPLGLPDSRIFGFSASNQTAF